MTYKELYEKVKSLGFENEPIRLSYYCNDDWYNYDVKLTSKDLVFDEDDGKPVIEIYNTQI